MTLEEMQDAIAANTKPPRETVAAMFGGTMPSFATLAIRENAAQRVKPSTNPTARKMISEARVAAILAHVRSNPGATVSTTATALGLGPDTARVGMVQLERQGLVVRGDRCNAGAAWTAVENNPPPAK
jgi:hypothetical protein